MRAQQRIFVALFIILIILFPYNVGAAKASPAVAAQAAVLIEASTGEILFEQNASLRMYPASTTKILTALLAVELGILDAQVTVGDELNLVSPGSSLARLSVGDSLTLGDLVYGLLLPSGNDAAYTIAVHLARQQSANPNLPADQAVRRFAELMNNRARELGARQTHFTAPDGYHDADHYTTAFDLALIARAALQHPFIQQAVTALSYTAKIWPGPKLKTWANHNLLIQPDADFYYPAATGFKTGYTGPAGFCFVGSASQDGLDLIAVCLNTSADGRWQDATSLLDYGFDNYRRQELVWAGKEIAIAQVKNGARGEPGTVSLVAAEGFAGIFSREEAGQIEQTVSIAVPDESGVATVVAGDGFTLTAPLTKGQIAGRLVYSLAGNELFATDLLVTTDVAPQPWWRKAEFGFGAGLLAAIFLITVTSRRRDR